MKMGAAWFNELEQRLKKEMPELHGGPFLHRFTFGNLHFKAAIEAGRKPEVSTMLAFELVFYLRMFTAGRAADSWQPMLGAACGCSTSCTYRADTRS
jgi:hypothetical protein